MKISRFQKSLLYIYQPELTTSKQQLTEKYPYIEVDSIYIEVFEKPVEVLNAFLPFIFLNLFGILVRISQILD